MARTRAFAEPADIEAEQCEPTTAAAHKNAPCVSHETCMMLMTRIDARCWCSQQHANIFALNKPSDCVITPAMTMSKLSPVISSMDVAPHANKNI